MQYITVSLHGQKKTSHLQCCVLLTTISHLLHQCHDGLVYAIPAMLVPQVLYIQCWKWQQSRTSTYELGSRIGSDCARRRVKLVMPGSRLKAQQRAQKSDWHTQNCDQCHLNAIVQGHAWYCVISTFTDITAKGLHTSQLHWHQYDTQLAQVYGRSTKLSSIKSTPTHTILTFPGQFRGQPTYRLSRSVAVERKPTGRSITIGNASSRLQKHR